LLACAAPAVAAPATVNLRVEATTGTLFEGLITTDAKSITKDGTGSHPCDGTNGGANPSAGPTATGALDDASIASGFTWAATWDSGFQDFFISRIGPDTNLGSAPYTYWGFFVNGVSPSVGGCQKQVAAGDDVVWAYANYGDPLLRLGAPSKAAAGESFTVTVDQTDGSNGTYTPAVGATVSGQTTDAGGHATLSFGDAGTHRFKATRTSPASIRSNAAAVCVYVPGSGDCGTDRAPSPDGGQTTPSDQPSPEPGPAPAVKDTTPPVVHISSVEAGKDYDQGPRELAGTVDDAGGIAQVFLRVRASDGGGLTASSRCRWFSGKRGVFTHRTVPCSKARFFRIGTDAKWSYLLPARLRTGKYVLDVKVLDRSYNAGRSSVPFGVK
jgi:hypothetical protein